MKNILLLGATGSIGESVLSVISQNILIIYVAVILFGFLISNVMPIVNRQSIKFSPYS